MPKTTQEKIGRDACFTCLSIPRDDISGEQETVLLAAYKKKGWGILTEETMYRLIHFRNHTRDEALDVADGITCDKDNWLCYGLSFPNVERAREAVESAEWK